MFGFPVHGPDRREPLLFGCAVIGSIGRAVGFGFLAIGNNALLDKIDLRRVAGQIFLRPDA